MSRRIRPNTHYAGNCCEWCDDLSQGRAIGNYPPEGCADWMCSDPAVCSGKGYGQLTDKASVFLPSVEEGGWENFDGTGKDFPWNNTGWSNFTNPPANTLTLSHHSSRRGPNSVLVLPDSDEWSNHPGFLWGTWWKDFWAPKAAERERANEARTSINATYPISGSCDLLTTTSEKVSNKIASHAGADGRGAKRIAKRETPILKERLKTINVNRDAECTKEAEEEAQQQALLEQMNVMQQQQQQKPGLGSTTTLMIGGVVLLGVGFLLYRALSRPQVIQTK